MTKPCEPCPHGWPKGTCDLDDCFDDLPAPAPLAKPTRVERGQRWRISRGAFVHETTLTDSSNGYWYGTACEHHSDTCGGWSTETLLGSEGTYLGTVTPPAKAEGRVYVGIDPGYENAHPVEVPAPSQEVKPAPALILREVSTNNGRDWCDYSCLVDADPFEAYPWRREWTRTSAPGFVLDVAMWGPPLAAPDPGRAERPSDIAGAAARALVSKP